MQTPAAAGGIVSLQLAWTPEKAQSILDSWDAQAHLFAAYGLGYDYLFMVSYALTIALGTLLAASRHPGWFARLGVWIAYGAFLAALCDATENVGQTLQLFNGQVGVAFFVGVCATVKFTLILAGIAYGLIGWLSPRKS